MRLLLTSDAASPRYNPPYRLGGISDRYEPGKAFKANFVKIPGWFDYKGTTGHDVHPNYLVIFKEETLSENGIDQPLDLQMRWRM